MLHRLVPSTAEPLPVIGLGTWQTFDVGRSRFAERATVLRRFVELGGRVIDSSPMYGRSEAVVGELAEHAGLHAGLFVATKVWTHGESAGIAQMEESFAKLRVARMDLLQVHNLVDVETHLRTLRAWKAAGRVRYVGITHYTVDAHADLEPFLRRGDVDFVQFNYSLAVRDAERRLLPLAADHGVATLINRPFEHGGMFAPRPMPLPSFAAALQCTSWAQLFLKYVIAHSAVTCVIPATSNVEHLEENMAAGTEPLPDSTTCAEIVRAWEALAQ
jgi:diketogulonate reductase-like aldo/keto reductase